MGDKSGIEWTDATWNPIVGCSKALMPAGDGKLALREGCRNCYAIRVSQRLEKWGQAKYTGLTVLAGEHKRPEWTGEVRLIEADLEKPLHWRKPRHIFVNSESDLFHEKLTDNQIDCVMAVMAACPQHTFQVLTKRPERMLAYFRELAALGINGIGERLGVATAQEDDITSDEWWAIVGNSISLAAPGGVGWPFKNLWLGVSIEDQASADYSVPLLLETPAALRWISAEPLLGPVRLDRCAPYILDGDHSNPGIVNAFNSKCHHPRTVREQPAVAGTPAGIRWVVPGGESGPNARDFEMRWAAYLVDQCHEAGVPAFVKQIGAKPMLDGKPWPKSDAKGGDMSTWPEFLRVREFPVVGEAVSA